MKKSQPREDSGDNDSIYGIDDSVEGIMLS